MVSLHLCDQAKEIMSDYNPGILENSAKMVLLFHLIEESVRKGDKLLVFRYKIRQHKNTLYFIFFLSNLIQSGNPYFSLCLPSAVRVCPH